MKMTNAKIAFEDTQPLPKLPFGAAADRYRIATKATLEARRRLDNANMIVKAMAVQLTKTQEEQQKAADALFASIEAEFQEYHPVARIGS